MLAERFLRLSCLPESCGITVLQKYVGDSVLEWFGGRVLYENEGARAVISCDLKGDVPEYSTQSSHRSLLLTCSQRVFVRNNFRHCQVAFYWQKSLYCKVQESATWVLYSVVVLKLIWHYITMSWEIHWGPADLVLWFQFISGSGGRSDPEDSNTIKPCRWRCIGCHFPKHQGWQWGFGRVGNWPSSLRQGINENSTVRAKTVAWKSVTKRPELAGCKPSGTMNFVNLDTLQVGIIR